MPQTFPFRLDPAILRRIPHTRSSVVVDDASVTVHSFGFHAKFPLSAVTAVEPKASVRDAGATVGTRGVHGWHGRWLVNTSGKGLVEIAIDPGARAWAVAFPVKLRRLTVSVEDPAGLMAALKPATPPAPQGPSLN